MCAYHGIQLKHATQQSTVMIIFPRICGQ